MFYHAPSNVANQRSATHKRRCPPYTRSDSSTTETLHPQAIAATFGVSSRYGLWGADGQELGCTAVACLVWLGLGALFSAAFLRVYRYHDVMVKHSGVMWPIVSQVSDKSDLFPPGRVPTTGMRQAASTVRKSPLEAAAPYAPCPHSSPPHCLTIPFLCFAGTRARFVRPLALEPPHFRLTVVPRRTDAHTTAGRSADTFHAGARVPGEP